MLPKVTDEVEEVPGQSDSELSDNSYSEDMPFGDCNESDIDWSQEEIDAASDDDENNDMEDIVDPRRRIRYVFKVYMEVVKRRLIA